jgi:hypothetical protein
MTVSAFIADLVAKFPHTHTNAEVVAWINEVDRNVYPDAEKNFLAAYYQRTANVSNIAFPSGVEFEDIESISVNGFAYKPADLRTLTRGGVVNRVYYEDNGKIELRPIPTVSDVSYVSGANEVTFGTNTITTTGDDFVGFCIGDTIKASGSLLATGNNKYATLVSVADKVMTFNPSTFTAQAEAAAITIQNPRIRMIYTLKPTDKVADEAGLASELTIPKKFQDIYRKYLMAEISVVRQEFGNANNYRADYNKRCDEYAQDYKSKQGIKPVEIVIMDGGWGNYETSDFDTN